MSNYVFKKYVEICQTASSVPSEFTFSAAGQLINKKKRTRLNLALAEGLLFLNLNDIL